MSVQNSNFQTSFDVFGTLEKQNQEMITKNSLALKSVLQKPVQLASALEVYKIHRAIMRITLFVIKQLEHFKKEWEGFLTQLNGYECTVKDSYPIRIDVSIAKSLLNGQVPKIECQLLNLEDPESRRKFIEFLIEMDACSFRDNHSREFMNKMLETKEARAFVAHHENRIVGGLWGFFAKYEGKKIFHSWLLIIRPDFSSLGVAKVLIGFAKQESQNYPDVTLVTLNVDQYNKHAKVLYDQEAFVSISEQTDKVTMGRSLVQTEDQTIQLSKETAKNIVKNYVLKNASVFELAYWEAARQSASLASKLFWSVKNPDYETLILSDDL